MKVRMTAHKTGSVCFFSLYFRLVPAVLAAVFAASCLEPVGPLNFSNSSGWGPDDGLYVTVLPNIFEYPAVDDNNFKSDGLIVMVYSGGKARDVTKEVELSLDNTVFTKIGDFSPALGTKAGPVEIYVRYGGGSASFRVYVRASIFYVDSGDTWKSALEAIAAGGESSYTIYVIKDTVIERAKNPGEFRNRFGIQVTLTTLPGKPATLTYSDSGSFLTVKRNQMVTIDGQDIKDGDGNVAEGGSGTLTFKGSDNNVRPLLIVDGSGAYLELRNGIIRDNTNVNQTIANGIDNFNTQLFGGGVAVYNGGFFLMNGGKITGCKSLFGAAIYINDMQDNAQRWDPEGKFAAEIKAGKIWGNACQFDDGWGPKTDTPAYCMRRSSGIVFVTKGRLLMSGGEISGNTLNGAYGAVYLHAGGSLYMLNGIIYGSDAKAGEDTALQGEEKTNVVGVATGTDVYHNSLGRGNDCKISVLPQSWTENLNMGRAYAVRHNDSGYELSSKSDGTVYGATIFNDGNGSNDTSAGWGLVGLENNTILMENGEVLIPKP